MAKAYRRDPKTGNVVLTREGLEEYSQTVDVLAEGARQSLADVLRYDLQGFTPDMTENDLEELRNILFDDVFLVVSSFGDAAGMAAAELYNEFLSEFFLEVLEFAQLAVDMQAFVVERAVRRMILGLFEKGTDKFIRDVTGYAYTTVRKHANDTMMHNVRRDRKLGVKYARVPTGIETCAFCIMLASRGFVYSSEDAAGYDYHYHANCDCRIVAGVDGMEVEGYNPDAYYKIFKAGDRGLGLNDTLNNVRREILYPVHGDTIRANKRSWYEDNKNDAKV